MQIRPTIHRNRVFIISLLFLQVFFAGCVVSTPYQSNGIGNKDGGYSSTRSSSDSLSVIYQGAAYSKSEHIHDYALLRSAELTVESGFKYFVVTSDTDRTRTKWQTMSSPRGSSHQRASVTGSAQPTYAATSGGGGGSAYPLTTPAFTLIIKMYKEKSGIPTSSSQIHEAAALVTELRAKYKLH